MQRGPDLAMARDRRFESTFLQRRIVCEPGLSVGITLERLDCLRRIRGRARRRGLAVGSANQLEERRPHTVAFTGRRPTVRMGIPLANRTSRPLCPDIVQKSGTSRRPDDDITPQDRVTDPLRSPAVYGDGGSVASVAERNQRTILRRGGRLPAAERRGCYNRCLYRQV